MIESTSPAEPVNKLVDKPVHEKNFHFFEKTQDMGKYAYCPVTALPATNITV